jgi:hypothetical protein
MESSIASKILNPCNEFLLDHLMKDVKTYLKMNALTF